ncbi:uncharacterized protein LOC132753277 isoform X2 [Ruditapes philippinarum]|uniref:uncharacterized protein LOC132753277 isoform X2 n=1 Tax=Ruditapes philippinarum TaxID=129788 RepID=UPI00295BFD96|nr:uncharacterized protein LOC132753277 isoform X2 [Ruditapes philippinarum]
MMTTFRKKSYLFLRIEKSLILICLLTSLVACTGICKLGYYGDGCDKTCPSNCDSAGCEQADGTCIGNCKEGFYGKTCKDSCPVNCKTISCLPDGTCTECKPKLHGDKCDKPCSTCKTACYKDTGNCTSDGCQMNYYGSKCEHKCNQTCVIGEGCDMMSGICGKCDDTNYGDFCEIKCNTNCIDEKCERNGTCKQGCMDMSFHGSMCDQKCSSTIKNCNECEVKDGSLSCASCTNATYGSNCDEKCPIHCEKCISKTECTHCLEKYSGKTCTEDCSVSKCKKCDTGGKCLICENGLFGEDCKYECPDQCETCDSKDMCKTCKKGYFFLKNGCIKCSDKCMACSHYSNCSECVQGRYGPRCDSTCPGQCLECTSADDCTKCKAGYDGRKCRCSHNCNREGDLDSWCSVDGNCSKGCIDGKSGIHCQIDCDDKKRCLRCHQFSGSCEQCVSGYYGKFDVCDKQCGNCLKESSGEVKCDIEDGKCPGACTIGFYNESCMLQCAENCDSTKGCKKKTGDCVACKIGFFGLKCENNCSKNCFGNKCNHTSGDCEKCISGFYGRTCTQPCPENCVKDCDKDSGICGGCKDMYYGDMCDKDCGKNCELRCERRTGTCLCKTGFYGEFCNKNCSETCLRNSGIIDTTVEISKNGGCDQHDGYCTDGCIPGWYNNTCESTCNKSCKHQICDRLTAECSHGCENEYKGKFCETAIVNVAEFNIGVIVGAVLGGLVFLVIVVITIYIVLRKRDQPYKSENHKKNGTKHTRPEIINLTSNGETTSSGKKQTFHTKNELSKEESAPLLAAKPDESDYYNMNTEIPVAIFTEYLQNRKREDPDWYKQEFLKLPKGLLKPCDDAQSFKNRGKCRYKQLYPYDETRVKIEPELEDETDFINASYVKGYKSPKAFIAAQGPVDSTVNDFWRMIFQKDCGRIVMLTNLFEECKMKCVRYWPETDEPQKYGCYEVIMLTEDELPNYTKRHLQATNCKTNEVKDFQHLHFTAWPDRGVPDNPSVMLQFRDIVMSEHTFLDGPILVHCSAGIGRTGTFVALDYLLKQAHVEPKIDLFKTITDMRYQRTNFVQTDIQYEFVHNAIAEALNTKDSEVTEVEFSQYYWSMQEDGTDSSKTKLQEQFEMINQMCALPDETCYSAGSKEENIGKNRDRDILPLDSCRAYLSTPVKGSNEYINAIFVPTCSNKTGFLITQMPLPHTVTDFWRLVYDQHVSNIVMMNNVDDDDEETAEYWPSDDSTYGPFRVKLINCYDNEEFSVMTIQLTHTSMSKLTTMEVKLFRYEGWADNESLPETTSSLTSLISRVSMSHRDSKTEAVIVHCMNGADRSGLFCAVSCVLERLQMEKKINIPQTVMQLRARRPQLIKTFDQFHFCYRAVLEYLESKEIYSNVL